MKKICFITTSRADFGTLNELIQETINEKNFTTQLIVSGSHYNKIFGKTEKEISYKKKCLIKPVYILQNNNKDSNLDSLFPCNMCSFKAIVFPYFLFFILCQCVVM